ncbi:hypothetical protein Q4530_08980 [Colwellia sp. 1_MG-2023]|jgi:hypothetical protein|uniref:hypothetical protein n=1 Tax=unclassified Colwellia TaxID=196834 RepID=UPI001C081759|nr:MULTISPECIES: hypothetical protein [unclassified Colwellia]MBU2925945.1 hypothetical protein [Colwellia sp. C2M11]MDO6652657.1 hypothetical protein [Colwellia sp. 3_MG-2023]MDO6665532.1 hypothetical protein [Colwellia sp. 2_MG-2023]MDO6689905.1 hypothetical protein [Colwellia sp. 1_MG-2023]
MINNISSSMQMPQQRTEQSLTEDQQSILSETLSQYDAENLSESDALNIVETLSQAGIQPSGAMEKAMSDLGFDAKSIGDIANVSEDGNRPPPPPKQSTEEITSMVDYLAELMEEKLAASSSNELSDEDKESILTQVYQKFDIEDGESIINTTA